MCRSELACEKLTGAAFIQKARVIVDVFREQARSYKHYGFYRVFLCLIHRVANSLRFIGNRCFLRDHSEGRTQKNLRFHYEETLL